jgi:hypothetical protein
MKANLRRFGFSSSPDIHPDEACTLQALAFPNSTANQEKRQWDMV